MKLQIGDICKLNQSNQKIKIIGFDDKELFYDCYWEHNKSWAFSSNLKKKGFFYRMNTKDSVNKVTKEGFEKLTEEQFNVLRPDLPLRIGRFKEVNWKEEVFESIDLFNKHFKERKEDHTIEFLDCEQIWLYSINTDNKLKKEILIESDDKKISIDDILFKANKIMTTKSNKFEGIGVYRLGIEKGIPSYYIGGYKDMMGNE